MKLNRVSIQVVIYISLKILHNISREFIIISKNITLDYLFFVLQFNPGFEFLRSKKK